MWKLTLILLFFCLASCQEKESVEESATTVDWQSKEIDLSQFRDLEKGESYLSIYSEIYSQTMHRTHDLTVTVSLRNTSSSDSIFISTANYYDTNGKLIKGYVKKSIFLSPLETIDIVINELDNSGGTGGNFVFDWFKKEGSQDPYFEAIMISTSGQQGLSFTTQGIRVK